MKWNRTAMIAAAAGLTWVSGARAQLDLSWNTYDCGGGISTAGTLELFGVIGQADAGRLSQGPLECLGGFIGGGSSALPCYANCDGSTVPPVANVADFICFNNLYAAGNPGANCDGSTVPPTLNVADFICFLNAFAAGCT
ncbi:MAG: GC-type dockerin domain-anchored protein [Phycisphaerales bacterium]